MNALNKISFLVLFLLPFTGFSGEVIIEGNVNWEVNITSEINSFTTKKFFAFKKAKYDEKKDYLPYYAKQIELKQYQIQKVEVVEIGYEELDKTFVEGVSGKDYITDDINLTFSNHTSRKINYGEVHFYPIVFQKGRYKRVVSYKIKIITTLPSNKNLVNNKSFATNSVLASGDWYKIAVLNDGIFKIDYNFLKNLGLDIGNLNPNDFKLYGNGGKMLPAQNSDYRPDDLKQNAVYVSGAVDGSFDKGDYVLFYGQSPHKWEYNSSISFFEHSTHQYSDTTFYFITFSNTGESPKRITTQASLSNPNIVVTAFNDYDFHERDAVNFIKSGSRWFGDLFDVTTSYNYSFNFPNIDAGSPIRLRYSVAARSGVASSFTATLNGASSVLTLPYVNMGASHGRYAEIKEDTLSVFPSSDVVTLNLSYNKPTPESQGWLDEIEVNGRRSLSMSGDQLFFRDVQSVAIGNIAQFNIANATNVFKVWELTDPFNIKEQVVNALAGNLSFTLATDSLRSFVAFTSNFDGQVIPVGRVENQNLHATAQKDMIILSHPKFLNQANQIADFHTQEGLDVIVVTPQQIYNEFSSGAPDIVAVRDFVRMLYKRAATPSEMPDYLLLVGDGSYDNKNRLANNTNYILTYQSPNSTDIIGSYVSDDYYGFLEDSEGEWISNEYLDIAIGRIPVKTTEEADNVVNKILNYNTPNTMKEWRNLVTFIGDDQDNNIHMSQSNSLALEIENNHEEYNVNKIYLDAFQQQSTPGGSRYPEVNDAVNSTIEKGALIVNYTGHGGEAGMAHERIVTISDINSWNNTEAFPLLFTATCELSRFDDPFRTAAGELMLIRPNGAIGLLTTVRLVYSSPNQALNESFYDEVFKPVNGEMPTVGEIFMTIKNANANSNTRNFTLLGDPALKLAYPIHDVATLQINGVNISSADTIKALEKVTVTGEVRDENGQKITNYNGVIYPTVFDKKKQITTLANDGGTPYTFGLQTSKLFKGKVSVTNGDFSYTFVVPKDIAYNFGRGKFSYYAENQVEDANGYHDGFYIGGTSNNYAEDNIGPEIELFMNDENFVYGGMTDENPILLANLYDFHGINMVGNGIGHDITAVLDGKTENAYILNDFYEADLNSYQSGKIYFPFEDLEEGLHTLTLKVWDVYNNSSEATIEFVVVKSKDIVLDRVYNYPNPFTTNTEFWFEHNQPGKPMYAQVQIYTVSGKLVKTLDKHILNEGYRSTSIKWNGLDEYGDRIGRGVYVYRLKVRADNYSVAEKYEKLVILQ